MEAGGLLSIALRSVVDPDMLNCLAGGERSELKTCK